MADTTLTDSQMNLIANALIDASGKFDEYSTADYLTPGLQEQFARQRKDVLALVDLFENADAVQIKGDE